MFDALAKAFHVDVGEFFVPEGHDQQQRRVKEIQECFLEVMEYTRNKLLEDLQRNESKSAIDHFNEEVALKFTHPPPPPRR
jgi:hypothetical protein